MITFAMSAVIDAKRERVWRALTDPREVVGADDRILGLVGDGAGYPTAGQKVRWRYRFGPVTLLMSDSPIEVVPPERLRCNVVLGPMRLEETYLLAPEPGGAGRTRLSLRVVAENSAAVMGGFVDRFTVRRSATEFVDGRIRAVQSWCELNP